MGKFSYIIKYTNVDKYHQTHWNIYYLIFCGKVSTEKVCVSLDCIVVVSTTDVLEELLLIQFTNIHNSVDPS
jgi:hypothetical protein